jgi:hypothetical protein
MNEGDIDAAGVRAAKKKLRRLLSVVAVERRYGISRRQQARLRSAGFLPYLQLTGSRNAKVYYRRADIDAFLASRVAVRGMTSGKAR